MVLSGYDASCDHLADGVYPDRQKPANTVPCYRLCLDSYEPRALIDLLALLRSGRRGNRLFCVVYLSRTVRVSPRSLAERISVVHGQLANRISISFDHRGGVWKHF